jgi:hypothetical protein
MLSVELHVAPTWRRRAESSVVVVAASCLARAEKGASLQVVKEKHRGSSELQTCQRWKPSEAPRETIDAANKWITRPSRVSLCVGVGTEKHASLPRSVLALASRSCRRRLLLCVFASSLLTATRTCEDGHRDGEQAVQSLLRGFGTSAALRGFCAGTRAFCRVQRQVEENLRFSDFLPVHLED